MSCTWFLALRSRRRAGGRARRRAGRRPRGRPRGRPVLVCFGDAYGTGFWRFPDVQI